MFGRRNLAAVSPAPKKLARSEAASAQLRSAFTARDAAQKRLDEERASVKRVEDVIGQARVADRAARNAHEAAREATRLWAACGCDPGGRSQYEELEAEAAEADRAADQAESVADSARGGLPAVEERVRDAQDALNRCGIEIDRVIAAILVAELEPSLKELERAAAAFNSAHVEVRGLYRLLDARRVGWNDFDRFASHAAAERIRIVLEQSKILELGDVEMRNGRVCGGIPAPQVLLDSTAAWRARAEALLRDERNAS
jgi:hypothetical protein